MDHEAQQPVCSRDCFHCIYADCILDDGPDEREAAQMERIEQRYLKPADQEAAERNRARSRDWYRRNRDKALQQRKAYNQAHREQIAARKKVWYANNRQHVRAQHAAYAAANREKLAAQHKAYCAANREKVNAYQRAYRARKKAERG